MDYDLLVVQRNWGSSGYYWHEANICTEGRAVTDQF